MTARLRRRKISTAPRMNYRQHQRDQANGRLAVLALRALGMWRDSWSHAAHRAGGLGGGFLFWAGQAPGSRFGDQWLLLSRRRSITPVFAVTSSSKRAGSEKIITVPEIRSCRTSSKLAGLKLTMHAKARAFVGCLPSATFDTRQTRCSLGQTEAAVDRRDRLDSKTQSYIECQPCRCLRAI